MKINKKILIVEDDTVLSWALQKKFKLAGFDLEIAVDGEDGEKKALSYNPDLILLDVIMPKMDGLTLLKNIKNNDRTKEIPVIILTNLSDQAEVMKDFEKDDYEFIIKSNIEISKVVEMVKKKLNIN